jgi:hypothetical protein
MPVDPANYPAVHQEGHVQLELLKTVLAGIAVLLAAFQVLVMLQVRGKVRVFPAKVRTLIVVHRWGGRAALALVTLIGLLCLYVTFRLGYPTGNVHVISHASLGTAAGFVIMLKVVVANRRRAYLRHALAQGLTAALLLTGAFAASGLVYLVGGA